MQPFDFLPITNDLPVEPGEPIYGTWGFPIGVAGPSSPFPDYARPLEEGQLIRSVSGAPIGIVERGEIRPIGL